MSKYLSDKKLKEAVNYNATLTPWAQLHLPYSIYMQYPLLHHNPLGGETEQKLFANDVVRFQRDYLRPAKKTGKLTKETRDAMWHFFENKPRLGDLIIDGKPLSARSLIFEECSHWRSQLLPYGTVSELTGSIFDLHSAGKFGRRSGKPVTLIVLHWGGLDLSHLHRYMLRTGRSISTHFGVGRNVGNEYLAAQFLDIKHRAYHAGYVNNFSVGVDIAQQPTLTYLSHYLAEDCEVHTQNNLTARGPKEVLSLETETAKLTRNLVQVLCSTLDVPFRFPRGEDGLDNAGPVWHGVFDREILESGKFSGVIGHHHISESKWDVACWWKNIFPETFNFLTWML